MDSNKKYDIILFGVTGFTGKLAAEYLLEKSYDDCSWAVCARNQAKAEQVLDEIMSIATSTNTRSDDDGSTTKTKPPLLIADLVCSTPEDEEKLRQVVQQTKVCLSCSGPFEKYGQTLVKLCAELGVSYADITGETDFFRKMIHEHDATAAKTGALIVCHCGNDCIPQDLLVYEMHRFAIQEKGELRQVMTYPEFPESASMSGGTAATATFQLSKDRSSTKTDFDPLLQTPEGTKSEYTLKNISPKEIVDVTDELGQGQGGQNKMKAGPWIMAPVMVNAVRRSNALLHYAKDFQYGDAQIKQSTSSVSGWIKENATATLMAAAIAMPAVFSRFLPQPGQGPDRETMEAGYLTLYGRGIMVVNNNNNNGKEEEKKIAAMFHFNKDIGYLYTAALLVETGMLLKEKYGFLAGGVKTPAAALGNDLTQRILKEMDTSLEIKEV